MRKKPKKPKSIVRKIKNMALIGLIFTSLYYGKAHKEFPRYLGLFKDPYKQVSLEEAINQVKTWGEAEDYMMKHLKYVSDSKNYRISDHEAPFKDIHEKGKDDCDGGAVVGAALLSDNIDRYETFSMTLNGRDLGFVGTLLEPIGLNSSHVICVVYDKETKKFGSLGINAVDCQKPDMDSIDDVFKKVNKRFLWMFGDYDVYKYDPATLIYGVSYLKIYANACKQSNIENQTPNAKDYVFLEHFHNPGVFSLFDVDNIPEKLYSRDPYDFIEVFDSADSYAEDELPALEEEIGRKHDVPMSFCYFYKDQMRNPSTVSYLPKQVSFHQE